MNKDKVLDLAKLSRIELKDGEAESLSHEFDAILGYVGEVKSVDAEFTQKDFAVKNVLREDDKPHEGGIYTEQILKQAPKSANGYIKVKKIL